MTEAFDQSKLIELGQQFEERRLEILRAHGISDKAVGAGGAVAQLAVGEHAGRGDVSAMTREELYERARDADIPGRSQMNREELAKAVQQRG